MEANEANNVISNYMNTPFETIKDGINYGQPYRPCPTCEGDSVLGVDYSYTSSLDSLVPVWVKVTGFRSMTLNNGLVVLEFWRGVKDQMQCDKHVFSSPITESGNLAAPAAIATAKAIKELKL